jgi:hypothetical protein
MSQFGNSIAREDRESAGNRASTSAEGSPLDVIERTARDLGQRILEITDHVERIAAGLDGAADRLRGPSPPADAVATRPGSAGSAGSANAAGQDLPRADVGGGALGAVQARLREGETQVNHLSFLLRTKLEPAAERIHSLA